FSFQRIPLSASGASHGPGYSHHEVYRSFNPEPTATGLHLLVEAGAVSQLTTFAFSPDAPEHRLRLSALSRKRYSTGASKSCNGKSAIIEAQKKSGAFRPPIVFSLPFRRRSSRST